MCFLLLLLLLCSAHIEPVITQDDRTVILTDGSNPCKGFVGIYHKGQLGYVGEKLWNKNTDKVVCRSTQCGEPVRRSKETALWAIDKVWLNEVNCTGNENHLWECTHPGWGVSSYPMGSLKKIECSKNIQISLDGFQCAGAVQYSTDGGKTYSGYICENNFGQEQGDLLCKNLGCGGYRAPPQQQWMVWKRFQNSNRMTIKCPDMKGVTNLWQCATKESPSCQNPASVMCTDFEILQLEGNPSNVCSGRLEKLEGNDWSPVKTSKPRPDVWCQQMHCGTNVSNTEDIEGTQLNCSDNVEVVLMDNNKPSRCYGVVHVKVNDKSLPVCASTWTKTEAEVVCKELNCGTVVTQSKKSGATGIVDNVKCSGKESSLWHCSATHDANLFSCTSTAYVICSKSVRVSLMDSPGKCAGRVEIEYEGQWRRVRERDWKEDNSNVVCRELGCGNKKNPTSGEKFSQGSADFLPRTVACRPNDKKISQCIKALSSSTDKDQAMGITCEEHKVVILKGNDSCSGKVGIKYRDKLHWLSGSKETWNQESANTVCRQKHCGKALPPTSMSNDDTMKDVWPESYHCLPNTKSLFDCNNTTRPLDHNNSIAIVRCSGKLSVNLTEKCWGSVNVCVDGEKCGSVCEDTWMEDQSVKLCEKLGCGKAVPNGINDPEKSKAFFTSLHCAEETDLAQCNFVRNENNITCKPAYVVCSGCIKPRFSDKRDKCSGNVEVRFEGQWLPVCELALKDTRKQNTICGEDCGQVVKEIDYFGPTPTEGYAITEIKCPANGNKSLAECTIKSQKSSCKRAALQCSNWSKMALTLDKACSGAVFVHSQGKRSAVSIDGWTETEGERLCQDLQCGKFKSNNSTTTPVPLWSTRFSCAGREKPENIWDCEKQTSQQNQTKEHLFIQCQDEPKVTLSKTCHGEVRINDIEVCASHWNNAYSRSVCQMLDCSNEIADSFSGKPSSPDRDYFHVSCEENHYKFGQCKRFKGKCDGKLVSIYCVGKVKFKTTEPCGGQIQVNYRDEWENVCPLKSDQLKIMESLCQGCHGHNRSIEIPNNNKPERLETTLACNSDNLDIKFCVHNQPCDKVQPAKIYCNDYKVKQVDPPESSSIPRVYIIVGVGLVLVLVALIVIFTRICIVNKGKNLKLRKEVEFESGDYDDVTSKANEMEVLHHGTFRSETEVVTENDARSTSSFPYDEIDEVAQPLTSEAATATAGAGHNNTDGVIYEGDDPQADYEDDEDEIVQTKAEVHDSPQTAPESAAAPPPGLVQGDEDYLVPGRDG